MARWTRAEDALLCSAFAHTATATLAERMGRSITQVSNRANLLGLRKSSVHRGAMQRARALPDGVERRLSDGRIRRKAAGRWWAPARADFAGTVPPGCVVRSNGQLARRADLMRENTWQRYPELNGIFHLKAQLTRAIKGHR